MKKNLVKMKSNNRVVTGKALLGEVDQQLEIDLTGRLRQADHGGEWVRT
jgi:hypothetical protein